MASQGQGIIGGSVVALKQLMELILWEVETRYCRRKVVLTGIAAAGVEVEYPIGRMLKMDAGGEGTAKGLVAADANNLARYILAERVVITAAETAQVAVIKRGPCLINKRQLVWDAAEATEADKTAQMKYLTDTWGIEFVDEPNVQGAIDLAG